MRPIKFCWKSLCNSSGAFFFFFTPTNRVSGGRKNKLEGSFSVPPLSMCPRESKLHKYKPYTNACAFPPRLSANVGSAGSAAVPAFNTVCSCQQDCLDTVFAVCPLFVWFHRVHFSLHALISRRLNNSLTGTGYTKAP